jgi:hypothetical protein
MLEEKEISEFSNGSDNSDIKKESRKKIVCKKNCYLAVEKVEKILPSVSIDELIPFFYIELKNI